MKGMGNLLRQAQMMQSKMAKLQEELGDRTVEGASGGGIVRVVCTGKQEIRSIIVDKDMVNTEDMDMLLDLITVAANDALRQSKKIAEEEMAAITGGINIPGL